MGQCFGVSFVFVLSGLLITYLMLGEIVGGDD
jgi:peptidoglycan/LPS O-acetylase OafA/YrhL